MMDLVSRKAVLSLLHGITMSPEDAVLFSQVFKYMEEQIKALPRWDGEKYCSVCYKEAYFDTDYGQQLFDYCPNCGAMMDERREDAT